MATMATYDAALKEYYDDSMYNEITYTDNPFLALVPKMEKFVGKRMPVVINYGNPQGRSATFSQAQAQGAATHSSVIEFLLTRVVDYSFATISTEVMEASDSDAGAFLPAATMEIDGALNTLTRSVAVGLYRDGFGWIGQTASVSGTTLTLVNASDITNFEVGQVIVFASTAGASALRDSGEALTIVSVNRSAGSMVVSANLNTISGITANDYIFIKGDRQDSASPARLKIAGLEAWIPQTAPTSGDNFFGIDRSVDSTRLAGVSYDGSEVSLDEALIEAASRVAREGGKIDHIFMNYANFAKLEKLLISKVQYVDLSVDAKISFRGIVLQGPRGPIKIIGDMNCPPDRAFGLHLASWELCSLGKPVRIIENDNMPMLRQASADGVEVRCGFKGNLACKTPGYNVNIKLPVVA